MHSAPLTPAAAGGREAFRLYFYEQLLDKIDPVVMLGRADDEELWNECLAAGGDKWPRNDVREWLRPRVEKKLLRYALAGAEPSVERGDR